VTHLQSSTSRVSVCVFLLFPLSYMLSSMIKSTLCLAHEYGSTLNALTYLEFSIELAFPVLRIKCMQVYNVSKKHFESRFLPSSQQIGHLGLGQQYHIKATTLYDKLVNTSQFQIYNSINTTSITTAPTITTVTAFSHIEPHSPLYHHK
jgi:hypothetical protein